MVHFGRRHSFSPLRRISALALTFGFWSFALALTFSNNSLEAKITSCCSTSSPRSVSGSMSSEKSQEETNAIAHARKVEEKYAKG